jgi:hypothetical protein
MRAAASNPQNRFESIANGQGSAPDMIDTSDTESCTSDNESIFSESTNVTEPEKAEEPPEQERTPEPKKTPETPTVHCEATNAILSWNNDLKPTKVM